MPEIAIAASFGTPHLGGTVGAQPMVPEGGEHPKMPLP
jgi:hypothetical protein